MHWNDLREYLTRLEALGERRVVRGATWEEHIGGITELMCIQTCAFHACGGRRW